MKKKNYRMFTLRPDITYCAAFEKGNKQPWRVIQETKAENWEISEDVEKTMQAEFQ